MGRFRCSYRGHDVIVGYLGLSCPLRQVVHHTGALPGLSALVSFLPSDKIGVTLFTNGESEAEPVMLT